MAEFSQQYQPTAYDEALYLTLLTSQVVQAVQQLYADGRYSLELYNILYEKARSADREAVLLRDRLEKQATSAYNQEMDERNRIIRENVPKPWLPLHDGE